jgi:hypothetical protein
MTTIHVYDPALCCSSGVCGTDVDQALVTFSADVEWARQNGANIERFNLAQQPEAFAENALVRAALVAAGPNALPVVLANGQQVLAGRYPSRDELRAWMGSASSGRAPLVQMNSCCGPNTSSAESASGGCC